MSNVGRRLVRLEQERARRRSADRRDDGLDLSVFTDEEIDDLAAIAERVKAGEPLGPADHDAIAAIEAAAEERTATP